MLSPDVKPVNSTQQLALPLPAIICIAIGAYIVLIIIILLIRQLLLQRGMCAYGQCCGKEGDPCCECCIACSESLNCCRSPNIEACLDSCCPARRQMDCVDIIMCQCCADPNNQCCGQQCDGYPLDGPHSSAYPNPPPGRAPSVSRYPLPQSELLTRASNDYQLAAVPRELAQPSSTPRPASGVKLLSERY
ncbi:hypothetical protein LSH36_3g00057 [Paralvinella palmiformis]|uniref:Uncharacterized protein n=1 Tax=Paralvinella palmiformis TaxID=53620 RepID=A0AAD9KEQ8_9ANNE|nr:hypothetical protein LSH36_3g00057 [Paralvinella palmiformis]